MKNIPFLILESGITKEFTPYDINCNPIYLNSFVIMPDPRTGDFWSHGDFQAKVIDVTDNGKLLIVTDCDDDVFYIEPSRVELLNDDEVAQFGLLVND
jgi:hypothetical protein